MGEIEITVTLLSFIWVVALTHILESVRDLWVARQRVKFAASQVLWMAGVLAFTILTWLPLADMGRAIRGWTFLNLLAFALGIFFMAAMVSPKPPDEGVIDLAEYENREGVAYKITLAVLGVLALPMNYGLIKGVPPALPVFLAHQWPVLGGTSVALLSLWPNRTLRAVCAAAVLALALYGLAGNVELI